ncbi:hypothetical protein RAA17_11745 [Komagataeibacter rhaeticus]|nr:hypothetical protein [Komagataeibacter rhaeticus]
MRLSNGPGRAWFHAFTPAGAQGRDTVVAKRAGAGHTGARSHALGMPAFMSRLTSFLATGLLACAMAAAAPPVPPRPIRSISRR